MIFLALELVVRLIIRINALYISRREKTVEWGLWYVDLVATIAMAPLFSGTDLGSALRVLRLIRLARPWVTIVKNLIAVIVEGKFMQEVNLVLLLLAVLSIGSGVASPLFMPEFDYNQDGVITQTDADVMARIWFAFLSVSVLKLSRI